MAMAQQSALFMQLHTPTGVTHCAAAFLTHAAAGGAPNGTATGQLPNLVLARSTALDVFSVRLVAGDWRLALCGRFPLFGVVESLAVLPGAAGQRDALLLTFREAKLSVLFWDPERHELSPSGLHYFEGDPALKAGRTLFPTPPMAVADPRGRCAAVVMYRHQLAVLPAMGSDAEALPFLGLPASEGENGAAGAAGAARAAATLGNSYVDNLAMAGIKEVRDAAFLYGYSEPVLLVLHEDDPTWAGNLRTKKDTCCLTALSLNLSMKRHPRIWGVQRLPSDARRIIPVPSGGALVLCTHMLLYYAQGQQAGVVVHAAALASSPPPPPLEFNLMREAPSVTAAKHAEKYACSTHPDAVASAVSFCDVESAVGLGLELDGAQATWLASDPGRPDERVLLLALRSGQLALVRPAVEGGAVRRLLVSRVGSAPPASCLAPLGQGLFFLGSHQGDSLLVRATPSGAVAAAAAAAAAAARKPAGGPAAVAAAGAAEAAGAAAAPREAVKVEGAAAGGGEPEDAQRPSTLEAAGSPAADAAAAGDSGGDPPFPKRRRLDPDPQQPGSSGGGAEQPVGEPPAGTGRAAMEVDAGTADLPADAGTAEQGLSPDVGAADLPVDAGTADPDLPPYNAAAAAAAEEQAAAEQAGTDAQQEPAAAAAGAAVDREAGAQQDGAVEDYRDSEEEEEEGEEGPSLEEAIEEAMGGTDSDEEALIYGEALDSGGEEGGGPDPAAAAAGPTGAAAGAAAAAAAAAGGVKYSLKIVDSLVNIGPIRDMAVGGLGSADYPPYLVTCGGRERGGALCMLRQHVVPEVITDVPLQGVCGVWAVHHRPEDEAQEEPPGAGDGTSPEAGGAEPYHSYLLISFPGSTKVLATGEELQEVTDSVEFATDTTTLAAGSVCGRRRIVQVFPEGVRILVGGEMLQDFWAAELAGGQQGPAGSTPTITAASILDPYVLLLLSDGTAALLYANAATGTLSVAGHGNEVLKAAAGAAAQQVTACSLHRDASGLFAPQLDRLQSLRPQSAQQQQQEQATAGAGAVPAEAGGRAAPDVLCTLCRADGQLEVFLLPSWQRVFHCRNAGEGPELLEHGGTAPTDAPDGVTPARILEVRLESFGTPAAASGQQAQQQKPGGPGPPLLALVALTSEHSLLAYQGFANPQGSLRFRRLPLGLPPVLPPAAGAAGGGAACAARLTRFDGMGEETPSWGLFVAGASPALLVAARGSLFPHPLYLPPGVGVTGFTPFHNLNCPYGFITALVGEGRGSLQICQPPARTRLDCPWPRSKVPLRATPLRIAHYPEADLFAVLTSRQAPYKPFLPEEEGGEPHASYAYAAADAAAKHRGMLYAHEVRLVDPDTWATVWRYSLLPGERALSVRAVHLRDTTTGATVPLLAVGAGFVAGEDYPVLGRVLLFRVHRAAEGGDWAAALVYSRDFRGPVSAVAGLEGYLLLSAGSRIETLSLATVAPAAPTPAPEGGDAPLPADQPPAYKFNRTSFFDGPMLVTSLNVVKNFVLLGDAQHSVQFVRYKDEGRQLALLSKDFSRADVTATEFLINGSSLHMACGDGGGVLRLLSYAPSHPGSWRGQKLVPWGAFQLGDAPLCMLRAQLHQAAEGDRTVRQAVLLGDGAGGIGAAAPLLRAEAAGVLEAVQRELTTAVRHTAGLNPAAFRMQHARMSQGLHGARWFGKPLPDPGVMDGDLLRQFCWLPRAQQSRVARAAGSSREAVLALLAETVAAALVF